MNVLGMIMGAAALAVAHASMVFEEIPVQVGDARYLAPVSPSILYNGNNYTFGYNVLLRSGDVYGAEFGAMVDIDGTPIGTIPSQYADFTSLLVPDASLIDEATGFNVLYMISQMESPYPSTSYLVKLLQNPTTGVLTVAYTKPIDAADAWSVFNPCAGSVTPWQTHLGSEENDPSSKDLQDKIANPATALANLKNDGNAMAQLRFFKIDTTNPAVKNALTIEQILDNWNPYRYGWTWEAAVDPATETATAVKHFAMGRQGFEQSLVMADNKTVFLTVDATSNLYAFVADVAGDLSSGCLYIPFNTQTSTENGGSWDITWKPISEDPAVACTDDATIRAMIEEENINFYDIFELGTVTSGTCAAGFTYSYISNECLKVKPGKALAASRLETPRYASMMGATLEFSRFEGITFDPEHSRIFTALTIVNGRMADTVGDVRVPANPCGCVYGMDVDRETFFPTNMYGVVCGFPRSTVVEDNELYRRNSCNVTSLASPDNLVYIPGHDALIIGEDTSSHQNDVLWSFDFATKALTRIGGSPFGSEMTSAHWYPNIHGFAYLIHVIQHPYGESDQGFVNDPLAVANGGRKHYVGYLGRALPTGEIAPFPPYNTVCPVAKGKTNYAACDDGNPCTVDKCVAGKCVHTNAANYRNAGCDDSNPCTTDRCLDGACVNVDNTFRALECNDNNVCTKDRCALGACTNTPIAGCVSCDASADQATQETVCADTKPSTVDYCGVEGKCLHIRA